MIKLNWSTFEDSTASQFIIYRAITGVAITLADTAFQVGDVLKIQLGNAAVQSVTITATDVNSLVSTINDNLDGVLAAKSSDATMLFIRSTATKDAKFRLLPCTFQDHADQEARTIVPALEWVGIHTTTFVPSTYNYVFTDSDGTEFDAYRISSVDSETEEESLPSITQYPQLGTDLLCAIEGRVCDSTNRPVQSLKIKASPRLMEEHKSDHEISTQTTEAITDVYGRFVIYLPRERVYLLEIPAISYNEVVKVPDQAAVGFLDLIPTLTGRFSPFEDPK